MTGIFWLTLNCNSVFFATTETLEESETYGKWLISKYNHYSKWEEIKAKGLLNGLPFPKLPNHQLHTVSEHLGFTLENHHNALADAEACAYIAMKIF